MTTYKCVQFEKTAYNQFVMSSLPLDYLYTFLIAEACIKRHITENIGHWDMGKRQP